MDLGLAGQATIVTGATSNIGRAIALALASEGAHLLAVGRDTQAGASVVAQALERGAASAHFAAIDLLEPDAGDRVNRAALDAMGRVDVLVNNVGGNHAVGLFADSDPAGWHHDIEITLVTVLRVTRAVLPGMIARKSGSIVNLGSTAGLVGDYMLPIYSAAKGAVHSFTIALAREVGAHNIRVNCVAPYATFPDDPAALSQGSRFHPQSGFFTQNLMNLPAETLAKLQRTGPLSRTIAKPEEVAAAVLFLASSRAAFTTGQIHPVDGGTLL